MDKILGIGNALLDAVIVVSDDQLTSQLGLVKNGMTLQSDASYAALIQAVEGMEKTCCTGGATANTILNMAYLGGRVGYIGKIGQDDNGQLYRNALVSAGVKDHFVTDNTKPTGICHAFVDPNGQRTMATYLGAAVNLVPEDITPELVRGYSYVFIEGYLVQNHDLVRRILSVAKAEGVKVITDLSSHNIVAEERSFFAEMLDSVDIVFANEEECEAFTGKPARKGLEDLAAHCDIAVVKTGANGVLVQRGSEIVKTAAIEVPNVIDTTGAGDGFAAGFLYTLAQGHSLERCAVVGGLVAAEIIQGLGAIVPEARWERLAKKVRRVLEAG